MKVFLIPFIFVFFSGYSLANTLTYKSPIYEFKRSSSCSTAMNGAKRKAEKSCRGAKVKSVSCVGCGMKKRFNTKTYVCTAKVKYSCSRGSSTSSRKKDTYTNKKIRQLRGKARTYKSKKRRKTVCDLKPRSARCNMYKRKMRKRTRRMGDIRG